MSSVYLEFSHEQVLALIEKRDPAFMQVLVRTENPIFMRMLSAQKIFGEKAEEVVHDTWERFFTNYKKFEGKSQLRTFLCGILLNKVRELRRGQNRLVLEEDPEVIMSQAFSEGWWKNEPEGPERLMATEQLSDLIEECLEGLSHDQRSAFVLKEVEEEESTEICNILSVSASNLRVLLFRAKDKLRKCLEGKAGSALS